MDNNTPSNTTSSKLYRLKETQFFRRFMASMLVGSGTLHGLAIGFGYLQPAPSQLSQPPELEIVIESVDAEPEITESKTTESRTTGETQADDLASDSTRDSARDSAMGNGNLGGDETLQVATLAPPQEIKAESNLDEDRSPVTPAELTDADLQNPIQAPSQPQLKPSQITQKGEKNGALNGTKERGLNPTSGKGLGKGTGKGIDTGSTQNTQGGKAQTGKGPIGNSSKGGKLSKPTIQPKPSPSPSPKIAISPSPQPKEIIKPASQSQPKPQPKSQSKSDNYNYERQDGERIAAGTKAQFIVEYDEKGRVKGGRLVGSTGDAALDAAQLRDFNRALDDNDELRQKLEARHPDNRNRAIPFSFEAEGEDANEREQIRRNQELTAQQEADRRVNQTQHPIPETAQQPEPTTPIGGINLPIPAPELPQEPMPASPQPEPVSTPTETIPAPVEAIAEPAPSEPAPSEPPLAAPIVEPPIEPPAVETPIAEPITEPVAEPVAEPVTEPIVETEAPTESAPPEPAPDTATTP